MKKVLALLLALVMVLGMVACGAEASVAASTAAESTAASAPAEETAEEAPAEEAPAEEAAPEAEASVPAEEAVEEPTADPAAAMAQEFISYPLEGDNEITMWYYQPPYSTFVDSNSSFNCIDDAEAATGVKLSIMEVPSSTASDQFNMMIASGDMCDLIPVREYYVSGVSKAYEEEIIIDIGEYVDEYMPNYAAVLACLPEDVVADTLTDGLMLAFSSIADGALTQNGLVSRADWLDELGISFEGETMSLDDFTNLLRTLHEEYDTPYTYYMTATTTLPVGPAFDISIPTLMGDGFMTSVNSAIFRRGDEITTAWTDDGFRAYMEYAIGLMEEGVLYKDFMSMEEDRMVQNTAQGEGQCAVWTAAADKIEEIAGYSSDPDIAFIGLPAVTDDPSAPYIWKEATSLVTTNGGMSISTSCENPELVCQWQNYFWTTEGALMVNFGVDGEALTYEGDEPRFDWATPVTSLGVNAPNADMALELFTMKRFATSYMDHDRLLPTYTDVALNAVELWTMENAVNERNLPATLTSTFTVEEDEAIGEYEADMLTYASENALKFLNGSVELNDETWAEYVNTINEMGMPEIIAVYQNAYDEMMAGER